MQRTMKHWNRLGECVNTKTKNAGQQPLSELKASTTPVSYTHLDVYKRQVK